MIFLIAASFRVFQKPETKNWLVSGIWRKSESKNHQFQVFQNPQRTIRFHERTGKLLSSLPCLNLQWVFDPKSKNCPTLVESRDFL
jgi:hypothetical protein